jgi:ribosome-associated heat shock protein Hsp15
MDERHLRVDKWLWAARFFKTRSQAAHALDGGRVLVNGARAKPAKALKPGDELSIRVAEIDYTVQVVALSVRRGPAADAARLYQETEESQRKREQARLHRTAADPTAAIRGRPTKKARRAFERLRGE